MTTGNRMSVTLPNDIYDALIEEAEKTGRPQSDLIRDAIVQMLDRGPWKNIGTVAEEAIRGGSTNAEAVETVLKRFPDANTSTDSVAWYRSRLRKDGEKIPTNAQAARAKQDI